MKSQEICTGPSVLPGWWIIQPDPALREAQNIYWVYKDDGYIEKMLSREILKILKCSIKKKKKIWIYHFRETVINFKGSREVRLHQDRIILGEAWWFGGHSLLQQDSASAKSPTCFFSQLCLLFFNFTLFITTKKSVLKWNFPTEFFFPLRSHHFPKKTLSEESHLNGMTKTSMRWTLLFWLMHGEQNSWFCWGILLTELWWHHCRHLHPSKMDSPGRISQLLIFAAKKKWKLKSKLNSLK